MSTKQKKALFSAVIALTLQCRTGCRVGNVGISPCRVLICSGAWIKFKHVSSVDCPSSIFFKLVLDETIEEDNLQNMCLYLTSSKTQMFGMFKARVWFVSFFQLRISNPGSRKYQKMFVVKNLKNNCENEESGQHQKPEEQFRWNWNCRQDTGKYGQQNLASKPGKLLTATDLWLNIASFLNRLLTGRIPKQLSLL